MASSSPARCWWQRACNHRYWTTASSRTAPMKAATAACSITSTRNRCCNWDYAWAKAPAARWRCRCCMHRPTSRTRWRLSNRRRSAQSPNKPMQQIRLFFIALQFFTRLPIPRWVGFQPDWLHHAARYFPLVGVVVAALTAAVYAAAAVLFPAPVAVLLSTAAGIYITGAFHEDGFADMCDGFGGGMAPERVMEIMKDSRIGAYGAIGTICLLALKCLTLSLLPPATAIATLFIAHPLSRLAATALIWRLDYARAEGKAKPMAQEMSSGEFLIAAVSAAMPALLLGASSYVAWSAITGGILAALVATIWLGQKFVRRIGGYTGDCLGAVQQVTELLFYLSALACLQHGAWH